MLVTFLGLNSKGLYLKNKGLENRRIVFSPQENVKIRQFHDVVVQRRRRDVPKKRAASAKLLALIII